MSKVVTHDGIRYLRSMPIRDEEMSPWKVKILKMRDSRVVASKILTGGKGGALPAYRKILSQFSRALSYPLRLTFGVIEEKIRMDYFRKRILQEILEFEPEIVHAHTPFKVGIPAMRAGINNLVQKQCADNTTACHHALIGAPQGSMRFRRQSSTIDAWCTGHTS